MLAVALVVTAAAASSDTADTLTITFDPAAPTLTNAGSGTIAFTVDDANALTSCALPDAALESCKSPFTWTGLAEGTQTLRVAADDPATGAKGSASFTFTIDRTPPSSVELTAPAEDAKLAGAVELTADAAGAASVEFRQAPAAKDSWSPIVVDEDAPYAAQWDTTGVADGDYQLEALARDEAGNTLASKPVVVHVENGAGSGISIEAPDDPSGTGAGSIAFGAEGAVSFECSLDGGDSATCTSPYAFEGLADGRHVFEVRATDATGKVSTKSVEWVVDTVAPGVEITSGPGATATEPTFTFVFASDDTTATFRCKLDDADPGECASPLTLGGLLVGPHSLTVEAFDHAGNSSTATYDWTYAVPLPPSLGGSTERVSVASGGAEAHGTSEDPSISADGRYVAFTSAADDLVPGDTNGATDVFVHDRVAGTTVRVSVATAGAQANGASSEPSISADGRLVAFTSDADNLFDGDDNETSDVFVHDLETGTTTLVSRASGGGVGNAHSNQAALSADGSFVAFTSAATNLGGDDSGNENVFRRNLAAGTTTMVSVRTDGTAASGGRPSISGDGSLVAFETAEPGLVDGDTNNTGDVFVRDVPAGVTRLVSHAAGGGPTNGGSDLAAISADGTAVAFRSFATNVAPGDANGDVADVFVADLASGAISLASVDGEGTQGQGASPAVDEISISGDGRYVAFVSVNALDLADALSPPSALQLYLRDRRLGTTVDVSRSSAGDPGNGIARASALSADGRYVAFGSNATNLVDGDGNGVEDVFVRDRLGTAPPPPTGGTLNVDEVADFDSLDPALANTRESRQVLQDTALTLPEASSMTVSDDGLTYTFDVPAGAYSFPDGEPVTAATFAASIERTLAPATASPGWYLLRDVVGAEAFHGDGAASISGLSVDGGTLTIQLKAAAADLPTRLGATFFAAVPPGTPVGDGPPPAGAGPYTIDAYDHQTLTLRPNDRYPGPRKATWDEIHFVLGVSSEAAIAEVESGKADYVAVPPNDPDQERLRTTYGPGASRQQWFPDSLPGLRYLALNTSRGPLADRRMRQAVNLAIDRDELVNAYGSAAGEATDQAIPPALDGSGYVDRDIYPLQAEAGALTKAAALVAAVYPNGDVPALELDTCNSDACEAAADVLVENLAAIGLTVRVTATTRAEQLTRLEDPAATYDLADLSWVGDYADPQAILGPLLGEPAFDPGNGSFDASQLDDETFTAALAAANALSGSDRAEAYADLDSSVTGETAPLAVYGTYDAPELLSSRVGCRVQTPFGADLGLLCEGGSELTGTVSVEADVAQAPAGGAEVPYENVPRSVVEAATSGSDSGSGTESAPVESIPVESIPVESIPVESIPVESIPVESIGLTPELLRRTIGGLPLNQVPLRDVPGGWPAVLKNTTLDGLPLQTVTLAEVLALPLPPTKPDGKPLALGDIDLVGTPLGGLPLAVLVLGGIDLSEVPIDPATSDNLAAWCTLLQSLGASCSSPSSLSGSSITSLALEGVPVESIPVESIPVESIPVESIPVESIPVESISLEGVPVESIPVESIAALVDCSGAFVCTGKTLGDALAAGALKPGTTLGQLLDALGDKPADLDWGDLTLGQLLPAFPADFTVGQLLLMLMPASALPWEAVPLEQARIQRFDTGGATVHYRARLEIDGTPSGSETPATVTVKLPAGFAYVPGTSVLAHVTAETSAPIDDPAETDGGLVYSLPGVVVGDTYDVVLDARPGIDLGSFVSSASVSVGGAAIGDSGPDAAVGVTDTFEPQNDSPGNAPELQTDRFYLSHVQSAGDSDYYRFHADGGRVVFRLSHLAADFDLVVYGPERSGASGLPAGPALDGTPLPDEGLPVTSAAAALPAESIQGEPLLDLPLWGFSINRDLSDEAVSIDVPAGGGDFVVQVAGYNGAFSNRPYMLRVQKLSSPALPSTCVAVPKPGTALPVASPDAATLGAADTLLVTNMQRLGAVYGAAGEQAILDEVPANAAAFASSGHPLALLPVENDPAVAAAYAAWDLSPCSVAAANAVVRAIVARIAAIRAAHPNIRYVALAGADTIVPFGRVDDLTTLANESGYLDTLAGGSNNAYLASFGNRQLLSDAPYGDLGPTPFLSTQLYVPELPVGRLVESPAEIAQALQRFGANDGLLDPATAKTALTTGYDFLADGAKEIDASLQGLATASSLISETWSRSDFLSALLPGGRGPDFGSLNAHYDHSQLLPADRGELVDVGDLAGAGTQLTGSLLFSIGCHSGASVPDELFASNTLDWAEAYARRDAVWLAQTGYGLGDNAVVGYSERLAALYAATLSTQNTVGDALVEAAQSYVGTQQVMGVYDAKVVEEATLYGLPTWSLAPQVERLSLDSAGPQPPATAPDPVTGLDAAVVTADPVFPAAPVDTGRGTYWTVEDGGLTTEHYRPIEPNLVQPAPADARGAVITALTTTDHTGTVPATSRPVVDLAAAEPALPAGDVAFPTKLQTITHTTGTDGSPAASLVLGVGQFLADPDTPGKGTQRNVVHAGATIYAGADATAAAPAIDRVDSVVLGSTVTFAVDAHSGGGSIKRVLVLFRDQRPSEPDGVHWLPVDLVAASGGTHWTGGASIVGNKAQYFVQVLSSAGTVSVSSNKGTDFEALPPVAAPPPPAGAGTITPRVEGPAASDGWFAGAASVTLTQSLDLPMQYRVDGGPLTDYSGPFQVAGDGAHSVEASSGDGATAALVVQVDGTAPVPVVTSPAAGAEYAEGDSVPAAYSCPDAGSGAATCDGDVAPGQPIDTTPGSHTFTVSSTDAAGNVAAPVVVAYTVRANEPPSVPGAPVAAASPTSGALALTWAPSTDPDAGDVVTYELQEHDAASTGWTTVASGLTQASFTAAPPGSPEGTWRFRVRATDGTHPSGFSPESAPVVVDRGAPTPPAFATDPAAPAFGDWFKDRVTVSATSDDPDLRDGSPGSGIDHVDLAPPQPVTADGETTVTATAFDAAGNASQAETTVKVDATPPKVTIDCAPQVFLGAAATVAYAVTDGESGPVSPGGTLPLDTAAVGPHTVTARGADNVGHVTTATCRYVVVYRFSGFFSPIDNDAYNSAKAGRAIPVKFSLGGDQGLGILADGSPRAVRIDCLSGAATNDVEETVSPGASTLSYDRGSDRYTYVWKTQKAWAHTCRMLEVVTLDGVVHVAGFTFK